MRLTEKKLLDNYKGITNAGDVISEINGKTYHWKYGYKSYDDFCIVDRREDANVIKVSNYGYNTKIIDIGGRCMNYTAYSDIIIARNKVLEGGF